VFGYHLTGSTGTLFLFGIAVGAVASLGFRLLLSAARRAASRDFIRLNSTQAVPT